TNAAGSSARRRRRSTPTPREQARPRKANRYPVSDSDEDKRASSMDSTAPTSPPVNAVDDDSSMQLPTRLFAPGFFPTALRLNIYSKVNVIGAVASALAGSADMDVLLRSQFGRLFHLPAACCHNSTKLIGSLLCRQLITARKYELWYTFGTHPLRLSLDEFHSITGLNCGTFDVEDSDSEEAAGSVMWHKLFDTMVGDITVAKVLEMLRNPFLASWKRLPLALIVLVDGLLAFEAVPQLLARIPDAPNTSTFLEDPSACATTVIILNTKDILAVETEPDVTVHFSLIPEAERHMWVDEVEDLQVNRLVHRLSSGHTFTTKDFRGEDKSFRGRGKQPENTLLTPEDKPEVVPIIQRNLRPRKPAAVVVEDVKSSEHNDPEVPHQAGSSPDKDLKLWLSEQLQNMARGIYERL
uniref:DUF1985 domain-containing protein n=1 Tax=Brassica oleracea var. oleracea TaxID=109376 RepID=A0A0D3BU76_BRAOL